MKRIVLALLAMTASTASAQLTNQAMIGHPIGSRILPIERNPPTLPRRQLVEPTRAPLKPRNVIYVPAPYGYYNPYYNTAQRQPDVNVSVTNVINQPAPVVHYLPVVGLTDAAFRGQEKLWDPEESIAAERNAASISATGSSFPEADRADVASMESIVAAYYDVHSGARGTARNWDRFRALFSDEGRLTRVSADSSAPRRPASMTPDDYRSVMAPELERGTFATEVSRRTERFGSMVHVFSTYELRRMAVDAKPFARGVNSMQLLNDGTRWWIVSVSWNEERADNPIPATYLPASRR